MKTEKEVEINFPWGGHFCGELEDFMKEIGLHAQSVDTGSDEFLLAYSKEPFDVEETGDYNSEATSPTGAKIFWFSSDWKHLMLSDGNIAELKQVGIGVILEDKGDHAYTAKFTKVSTVK